METCSVCRTQCRGGFDVYERVKNGVPTIVVDSTPDRNFNVCDLCNVSICFDCSKEPDSGYCNQCLARVRSDDV